jgi:hypothetical protein
MWRMKGGVWRTDGGMCGGWRHVCWTAACVADGSVTEGSEMDGSMAEGSEEDGSMAQGNV